ncbi:MAG: hypothetical protein ABS46_20100 [Cytophagaceae bacterium SCN 52-12]|nr:MAG: hypothetical protein ABS46_20100 [Cytophagaceae bacterium SCN 52-12]
MLKYFFAIAWLLIPSLLPAQRSSFAIVVDSPHLERLRPEIDLYRQSLEEDGLTVHLVPLDNGRPEAIRQQLHTLYKTARLEGAVLIGNVPVPMIRDAQHLTSTFKMPQDMDWIESSVPSDRYYDDFDLQFEFLKQDDSLQNLYYYRLLPESRHVIGMDIYTGRIKAPARSLPESVAYIRKFLLKLVEERKKPKQLSYAVTFTGEGYNSNALNSWASLVLGYREQFASLFQYPNRIRFMDYRSHQIVKPVLLSALKSPEVDFAYLNGHGLPEEQILSANPEVSTPDQSMQNVAFYIRETMRKTPEAKRQEKKESLQKSLGLNDKWFENAFDPEQARKDSLYNADKVLSVSDMKAGCKVNAKVVYMDACFTGAFQYDEYLAGFFPFGDGRNVAVFANSVGVLQDLWANELIGLLQYGTRTGQILKHTAYLETHIIGDPAFRFDYRDAAEWNEQVAHNRDAGFWKRKAGEGSPDLTALSLHKIARFEQRDKAMAILEKYFYESPFATVRTEAFIRLKALQPAGWRRIVIDASADSFEFLRRLATYEMGEIGHQDFITPLVDLYFRDRSSNRTAFNVERMILFFDKDKVLAAIGDSKEAGRVADREFVEAFKSAVSKESFFDKAFLDLGKNDGKTGKVPFAISILRAYRFHQHIPAVLAYLEKNLQNEVVAVPALEALSWFGDSVRKEEILAFCSKIRASAHAPEKVRYEAGRTAGILEKLTDKI